LQLFSYIKIKGFGTNGAWQWTICEAYLFSLLAKWRSKKTTVLEMKLEKTKKSNNLIPILLS
jgi:hypothetical protein